MTGLQSTLPTAYYRDPEHYRREIDLIWHRDWLCVGRAGEFSRPGEYRVIGLPGAEIIVTLGEDRALRAFHNTCRHRGSQLCAAAAGRFRAGRIVCPYHAWAYGLDGSLRQAPGAAEAEGFDPEDYPLYPVALERWGGWVFINLDPEPDSTLHDVFGPELDRLSNWPLEELALAHRESHAVDCNWKVFWENYMECYHCPGVHPDLCRLVPLFGLGLTSRQELPPGSPLAEQPGHLRAGAVTWSEDGQTPLPWLEGLSEGERQAGMTYADFLPGMFVVAHVDHVRSVRLIPQGPESLRLDVDWLVHRDTLADDLDTERLVAFGRQVVAEDAGVCERNQAGLACARHAAGVLLPREEGVLAFDRWLQERLQHA